MTQDKKALGQESGKPDWFQLVDSDAPSAQVAKVNKKIPAIALIVTGVIAVSGTFFANASNENQVIGSAVSSTAAAAVSDVVDTNTNATPQASATTSNSSKVVSVTSTVAPTGAVQNPSQGGVAAPSAGRDDDDEDEDHWGWLPGRDRDDDDEEDDDDHEEREGHEREKRH